MKVLVVDDSHLMRGIVRQAITEYSPNASRIEILEAVDGQAALEIIAEDVDLVIVDWNMPKLDGLSFVKKVRADGFKKPIIMITSVNEYDSIMQAVQAGITCHVEKPIRDYKLWDRIREYFVQ